MRLAIRLFSVCFLLEIVGLYHYLEQDVRQFSYPPDTSLHKQVDQISPSDSTFIDLVEFLEGKDGDENSEEDNYHSLNSATFGKIHGDLNITKPAVEGSPSHRLLNFKIEKYPLFILYHSWKLHTA